MHVNVWFIEHHRAVWGSSRKEPYRLKPHLKAMSHPANFRNKVPVSNGKRQ